MAIISNCTVSAIKDATASLIAGNLVAFPTETVYGLGADALNVKAVARIYKAIIIISKRETTLSKIKLITVSIICC